jgi:DNA-binding FadR family transcriptional regulator
MARLHVEKMREILRTITSGELRPGDPLPREVDLARDLEVSRPVARASLQGLVDRGVVVVKHGRGQTVRPEREWNILDPEVVAAVLDAGDRRRFLREILEARTLVDPEIAALAAQRSKAADVEALEESLGHLADAAGDERGRRSKDCVAAEAAFLERLAQASGNRPLARAVLPLQQATSLAGLGDGRPRQTADAYRRVLDAVAQHDGDAARDAMRSHLETLAAGASRRRSR